MPVIHKWMTNRNDQLSRRTYHTPEFLQRRRNVLDVHQDVVSDNEIKLSIVERQLRRRCHRVIPRRFGFEGSPDEPAPPTAITLVSGTGFGAQEDVDIYFDTADLALASQ